MRDVRAAAEGPLARAVIEDGGPMRIGPAARAQAKALQIDPSAVAGTGPKNVITKDDIMRAARSGRRRTEVERGATGLAKGVKAAPKVRALARDLGVDLFKVAATGHASNVTVDDVHRAAGELGVARPAYRAPERSRDITGEPAKLIGARRIMANAMARANQEVTNTTIFDEADIGGWARDADITLRVVRAITAAARVEPALNAWFDGEGETITMHRNVNLGIAVDSERGLFVPVIRGADALEPSAVRKELQRLRKAIADQSIKSADMKDATITLSNFGMIAGLYGTTIVSPPEVAIVGVGRLFHKLVMTETGIENRRFMPLSLSFDHRAATGGEAARFLRALIEDLELMG